MTREEMIRTELAATKLKRDELIRFERAYRKEGRKLDGTEGSLSLRGAGEDIENHRLRIEEEIAGLDGAIAWLERQPTINA
jgi:hypothetical protein